MLKAKTKEEFDAYKARLQAEDEERKQKQAEHAAFVAQARARQEALARGEIPPVDVKGIPSLDEIFAPSRAAAVEAQKQAYIQAALKPVDTWTLEHLPPGDDLVLAEKMKRVRPYEAEIEAARDAEAKQR